MPSLLTTVDEHDEAGAKSANESAVQVKMDTANGAAKNKKKKQKRRR
jgi:hypothetical protein